MERNEESLETEHLRSECYLCGEWRMTELRQRQGRQRDVKVVALTDLIEQLEEGVEREKSQG